MMQKQLNLEKFKKYQDEVRHINSELTKFTRKKFDNIQNILSLNLDETKYLSNFAITPFCFEDSFFKFESVEQYYQYTKALFFGNNKIAKSILDTSDSILQKKLAKKINMDFSLKKEWEGKKVQYMYLGLEEKFKDIKMQNLLLSTKNKFLTHLHPTLSLGSWEVDFPALLMYIRDEYKQELKVCIFINRHTCKNEKEIEECLLNIDNVLHQYDKCKLLFEEDYNFLVDFAKSKNIKYETFKNQADALALCNEVIMYGQKYEYIPLLANINYIKVNSVLPQSEKSMGYYQQIKSNTNLYSLPNYSQPFDLLTSLAKQLYDQNK